MANLTFYRLSLIIKIFEIEGVDTFTLETFKNVYYPFRYYPFKSWNFLHFGKESFPEIIDLFGLEHLHMYDIIVDTVDLFKTGK